ncbi:MAG: TonB-dependent siderophore receptor [Hansschlegelia sp.]
MAFAAQIECASAQDATPLPEINVQGQGAEKADGPVKGYVATRTATGTKTDTPVIETPQSISIVTRDEIKDRGASTLQEAVSYTPGVASFSSGRSLFLDEFIIRGFDTAGGDGGQLRDGLKLQANVYDGAQEPYGLERVEILKGPASILFGQLGPGGVVNSISKKPTFEPQGEINVTGGSFDDKQLSADISGPVGTSGDWAYRITGLIRDSNTWMNAIGDDKRFVAPALTWAPDDQTSLTLLGYYQEIRTRFKAPMNADGTVFATGGRRIPRDFFIGDKDFDKYDINSGAVGYLFDHEFDNHIKFSSKLRYFEAKADWDYLTFRAFNPVTGVIDRGVSAREEHSKVWTADNNIQFKVDTGPIEHTAVFGVDYVRSDYDTTRLRGNNGGTIDVDTGAQTPYVPPTLDTGFDRKLNQVGLYAQDQLKIAEKLILLAGGRQDWVDSTFDYHSFGKFPKQKDDAFTAHLGAIYLMPYGFAPYVSYSESYQPVVAGAFFDGVGVPIAPKPTTGTQYEGGLRWQSPDAKTLVTASIYRIDQKNTVTDAGSDTFRQLGKTRSTGFELEAKTEIEDWRLSASYAYTHARTIEDEDSSIVGQQLSLVPWNQASVWAIYDVTRAGVPGLSIGAGAKYFGKTNIPDDPAHRNVPGYVTVDAVARLDLGKLNPAMQGFQAQINAKNVLDKKTYSCTAAIAGCNYGQPRTIVATLSYRW